jgi:hypothetical protein
VKVGDLVMMKGLPEETQAFRVLRKKFGVGLITELWNHEPVYDVEVWWPKNHSDCSRTMSVDILEIVNESR